MAENLNYEASGSKCYENKPLDCEPESILCDLFKMINRDTRETYGDITNYCDKYGRLYDLKTAKTVCPSGWHLPSNAEWDILMVAVGGEDIAGKYLKTTSGWKLPTEPDGGGDKFGFSALPGGLWNSGAFLYIGYTGNWWTSDLNDSDYSQSRSMGHNYENAGHGHYNEDYMNSVRCLKD